MSRKLKFLLTVGHDDQERYGIPNSAQGDMPPQEGEALTVEDDRVADICVNKLKVAEDYDAQKEKKLQEETRKKDEQVRERILASSPQPMQQARSDTGDQRRHAQQKGADRS